MRWQKTIRAWRLKGVKKYSTVRIIKKSGDIFKLPLSDGKVGYAQWLHDGTARFFLAAHDNESAIQEILDLPVAFRVVVYKDTPNRYGWTKLGNASIPIDCMQPQRYAKRGMITGQLSVYFEGKETPAKAEELIGLETAAVWAHPHIVERLEAQINRRESVFLKSIKVV